MNNLFSNKLKLITSKYGGVFLGAVYGLILRLVFNIAFKIDFSFTDLFSITFIWIVPVFIGITPMLFARPIQLERLTYRVITPCSTVLVFFMFCFITRIEDILCILVISAPFLLGAMIGGLIFGKFLLHYRKNRGVLYSVLLIPFMAGIIEDQFKIPTGIYYVDTTVLINSDLENIWKNVVRVREISNEEYTKGVFNYAGIPRPLFAELNKDTLGATRAGHFEGGLMFIETVNHWEKNRNVSFSIKVLPSTIRNTVFDRHILTGNHFEFLNASYTLKKISNNKIELSLASSYRLDTRINQYASFWGNCLLSDFQKRLLKVIKQRCESSNK